MINRRTAAILVLFLITTAVHAVTATEPTCEEKITALRPVVGMNRGQLEDEVFRVIHEFDMLVVMSGSTPSGEFGHD